MGHNVWTDDKDDWDYGFFNYGWDYDSPVDVANWDKPGYDGDLNKDGKGKTPVNCPMVKKKDE